MDKHISNCPDMFFNDIVFHELLFNNFPQNCLSVQMRIIIMLADGWHSENIKKPQYWQLVMNI